VSRRVLLSVVGADLQIADLDRCASSVVSLDSSSVDAVQEAGGRVFVDSRVGGGHTVAIIDLDRRAVVARAVLADPPRPGATDDLELLSRDGIVFYNDPHNGAAGVIGADGSVTGLNKHAGKDSSNANQPPPRAVNGADPLAPVIGVQPGTSVRPGEPATFTVTPGPAAAGPIADAVWDFGDHQSGAGIAAVQHAWSQPSHYRVTVKVHYRGDAAPHTASIAMDVSDQPLSLQACGVSSGALQHTGDQWWVKTGDTVTLAEQVDPPGGVSWRWTFDDGTGSNAPSPQMSWSAPGDHDVNVAATNSTGDTVSCAFTVHVITDPSQAPQTNNNNGGGGGGNGGTGGSGGNGGGTGGTGGGGGSSSSSSSSTSSSSTTSSSLPSVPMVTVPNVTGSTLNGATLAIRAVGLNPMETACVYDPNGGGVGIVHSQDPNANTSVPAGSEVKLVVGRPGCNPPPPPPPDVAPTITHWAPHPGRVAIPRTCVIGVDNKPHCFGPIPAMPDSVTVTIQDPDSPLASMSVTINAGGRSYALSRPASGGPTFIFTGGGMPPGTLSGSWTIVASDGSKSASQTTSGYAAGP
jgi:hypothetical protein